MTPQPHIETADTARAAGSNVGPEAAPLAIEGDKGLLAWRKGVTAREAEILDRLARGLMYAEIGGELGISNATVKNHLHRIYAKIEVRSRTEAVVKWLGH